MTTTVHVSEQPTISISEEIYVNASIETTFASLLEQIGPSNQTPDGQPLSMVIEARPGGRWFRDLGGDNGHLWGFVQSIKRPSLLELWGPMFMSTAATNNFLYRLSAVDGGTVISFKHTVVGPVPDEFPQRASVGWQSMHARVKQHAEAAKA